MDRLLVIDVPGLELHGIVASGDVEIVHTDSTRLAVELTTAPVAVVSPTNGGVAVAQRVHAAAPAAAVLLLAPTQQECDATNTVLAVTPGIGRRTRCTTTDDPRLLDLLIGEIDGSRRRHEHRRTMQLVRRDLRQLDSAPPEALSRYLGSLFEHAPIGILVADREGVVQAANPRSADLLGAPPRQTVGIDFDALFRGGDSALAADLVTDCLTTHDAAVGTLKRIGPSGTLQHIEITVATIDPTLPELGVIVLLHDETERIHAIEAAEHSRGEALAAEDRFADLARTLQRSLLPPALPEITSFDVAARYHAAADGTIVGGDFYDLFPFLTAAGAWCSETSPERA